MSITLRRAAAMTAAVALAAPAAAPAKSQRSAAVLGVTSLEVTAPLGALGLSAAPIRPATASGATFRFSIATKFKKAERSGRILHTGGITLSGGGKTLQLRNFLIRLDKGDLTAEVARGVRVPIVTLEIPPGTVLRRGAVGPVVARLTPEAAGALTATFGAPDLTGAELGRATIQYADARKHDDD